MSNLLVPLILILSSLAFAQPDAPQPQPKREPPAIMGHCGPRIFGGCWDYSHPTLSIGQTFKSPNFIWPTVAADTAYALDAWQSREAIDRGCVESNTDLPPRTTAGDYAKNWALKEFPMDVGQWALTNLNRPITNWMVRLMAAARVSVHMKGVVAATGCR